MQPQLTNQESPQQTFTDSTVDPLPKALTALLYAGGFDIAFTLLGGLLSPNEMANSLALFAIVLSLEGGLLWLIRQGSKSARNGLVAFHGGSLLVVLLSLLPTNGTAMSASELLVSLVGAASSIVMLAIALLPRMSHWLAATSSRRHCASASVRKVSLMQTALIASSWTMLPLVALDLLVLTGHKSSDIAGLLLIAIPVALAGLVTFIVQMTRYWKLNQA